MRQKMSAFGLLSQYSRDLREFRRTGKPHDLSAWAKLFASTNGMINDGKSAHHHAWTK
jgi:hypothetical protein